MTAAELAERLHARRSGDGWSARCPAHEDRNPSLSIHERDGKILIHCHASCTPEKVCAAIGIGLRDLFLIPPRKLSRSELHREAALRARAETAAWRVRDEVVRLCSFYRDGLHRAERLMARTGEGLLRSCTEAEQDAAWERIGRLAPVTTYFLASFNFVFDSSAEKLARFALASPAERRAFILEGES
jgi:hypothetical protein